jgi:hypothetical protein
LERSERAYTKQYRSTQQQQQQQQQLFIFGLLKCKPVFESADDNVKSTTQKLSIEVDRGARSAPANNNMPGRGFKIF